MKKPQLALVFDDEFEVEVVRVVWETANTLITRKKRKLFEEEIIGTFEQFPIRLVWPYYKSQGLVL